MSNIYRKPNKRGVGRRPWDEGSMYTMRLLTFLFKLNMKGQTTIIVPDVDLYARRMMHDPLLVGQR